MQSVSASRISDQGQDGLRSEMGGRDDRGWCCRMPLEAPESASYGQAESQTDVSPKAEGQAVTPHYNPPGIIYVADMTALVTLIGSFAGELPTIAAGLAALWYVIAIIDAVRRWFRKPRNQ